MKSHLGFLSAFCPRGGGVNKTMWNIGGGGGKVRNIGGGGKVRNIGGGGGGIWTV